MSSVGAHVKVGLIETVRAREGRLPWLGRHLERLRAAVAAHGAAAPPDALSDLIRFAAGSRDRVVRVQVTDGHAEIATRDVNAEHAISVVVSREVHRPYPYKTTAREQFGRALAGARRLGARDALLVTAEGFVAEGTTWNVFWWDKGGGLLCTPASSLGILPGLGRQRIMELAPVEERQARVGDLARRSLFVVNAVRGVVQVDTFEGSPVPRDPRTVELAAAFWPD
jgi:para-aminobenzoate synthetase / 4-amino-4-deoxychorismate lyase